jgi:hypothetical protein
MPSKTKRYVVISTVDVTRGVPKHKSYVIAFYKD